MVPLVMKHCHLSHKGIQGTLKLARDNVFWPGMAKDLTNYIQTCKACTKIQNENTMEPITMQPVPERPWSVVATDLFHLRDKNYIELKNITSAEIIQNLKSWFSIFGIPDTLLSDGGKQYDCQEFRTFKKEWNFEHRISSPHFPRSNGLAERYVQEAKNLLKKCLEVNSDVQLALLHHRNTPRLDLGSPAQRMFNRRTKTLLPTNEKLFSPKIIQKIKKKLENLKGKEKINSDKGKKEIKQFEENENVLLRRDKQNWVPATIIRPEGNRSYIVRADNATYRRNAWHLKHTTPSDNSNPLSTGQPEVSPAQASSTPWHDDQSSVSPPVPAPTEATQPAPSTATEATQPAPSTATEATPKRTTRSGRVVIQPARYRQ
ncbi:hypothetical protein ABMA27_011283 [Loxostege sticticalis]|uniref:RNA-directed DNA polymerase n=1 Tax=Loxostege sticticalis TaxID=481309 RepID=A0ABR3H235_LOXSC